MDECDVIVETPKHSLAENKLINGWLHVEHISGHAHPHCCGMVVCYAPNSPHIRAVMVSRHSFPVYTVVRTRIVGMISMDINDVYEPRLLVVPLADSQTESILDVEDIPSDVQSSIIDFYMSYRLSDEWYNVSVSGMLGVNDAVDFLNMRHIPTKASS